MNLPNRNNLNDFSFPSSHFNENGENKVESLFQLDKPSSAFDTNHKIRPNDLYHFGYDTNSIEYHTNFGYENLFETNKMVKQQCTPQSIAYDTNYAELNQTPNDTRKFSIFFGIFFIFFDFIQNLIDSVLKKIYGKKICEKRPKSV